MKRMHRDFLPKDAKIITGPRGGQYYINKDGEKVLVTSGPRQPSRNFKFNRGKFQEWYERQNETK